MIEARQNRVDGRHAGGRKPYGHNISDAPLPQAIFNLAQIRGYRSQEELAWALGMTSNSLMSRILTGKVNPGPKVFSKIIDVLNPDDIELQTLLVPYREALIQKEKNKHKGLSKNIKPSDNPVGQWIEKLCNEKGITLRKFDDLVDCQIGSNRRMFGFELLSTFLQNAPTVLDLSEKERRSLDNAVNREIRQRKKEQRPLLKKNRRANVKKMQKEAGSGFTGGDAARKLRVLRGTVGHWADKLGMPLLLSEQDVEIIRLARLGRRALRKKSEVQEHVIFHADRLAS